MDRGAWLTAVHRISKSRTHLSYGAHIDKDIVCIKYLLNLRHSTRHGVKFTFLNTISSRHYYPDFKVEKTISEQ